MLSNRCAMAWWCLIGIVFTISIPNSAAMQPLSEWSEGVAKHFGGPQEVVIDPHNPRVTLGGCSYGELNPQLYPFYNVASFHPESPFLSGTTMSGCGTCFEIQCVDEQDKCVNGPLTNSIVVVNSGTCGSGCSNTQVNLHVFAFDKLAPIRLGQIRVRMRQVKCQPLDFLIVRVKTYRQEEGGYLKLVIRNIPGDAGLSTVELKGTNEGEGNWRSFENFWGAAWEVSRLPELPYDLRLTSTDGETVILRSVIEKDTDMTQDIVTKDTFPGYDPFPASRGTNSAVPPGSRSPPKINPPPPPPPMGTNQTQMYPVGSGSQGGSSTGQPNLPPVPVPVPVPVPPPTSSSDAPGHPPGRPEVDLQELSNIEISGGKDDGD